MSGWQSLFGDAVASARKSAAAWLGLRRRLDCLPPGGPARYKEARLHENGTAVVSGAEGPVLEALCGCPGVATVLAAEPPSGRGPWLLVKKAYNTPSLAQLGGWAPGGAADLAGGPSPAAAALASGLLGAGVGYGAGWLGERLLPESRFRRGRLRQTMALAGAGLGAAPGLWWGSLEARARPDEPWPDVWARPPMFYKTSEDVFGTGLDDLGRWPAIPREGFNQSVWSDRNTPDWLQAQTAGLVDAAALARRSQIVTPGDVARVALNMGAGYAAGSFVGRVLGALAGLRPEAQQKLQEAGVWAGVLNNAVSPVYRP